jgi:hypothetical protein
MWWQNKNISNNQLSLGEGFDLSFKKVKCGDIITFHTHIGDIKYMVNIRFLGLHENTTELENDKIFRVLNLNKREFCNKSYGYPVGIHISDPRYTYFPECKEGDYEALGRVIYNLKLECLKQLRNVVA